MRMARRETRLRKVVNHTNQVWLERLGEEFIAPLLDVLVHAKSQACRVQEPKALSVVSAGRQKILTAAFAISLGKSNRKTFGARCNVAVKAAGAADLAKLPGEYAAQLMDLRAGLNPKVSCVVPKSVTTLFKDVIYGKLFDNQNIWTSLGLATLTRMQFHDNFAKDNGYPSACPYCDLDTMNSPGASVVEHLFPKSVFPLLAMDGYNLFSSCWACNGPAGKRSATVAHLASPYDHEVGVLVDFKHDAAQMKLEILAQPGRPDVEGYLALLQLPVRYARPMVWAQFNRRQEALVEALSNRHIASSAELDNYVAKQQGGVALTYAVAHWARSALAAKLIKRKRKT